MSVMYIAVDIIRLNTLPDICPRRVSLCGRQGRVDSVLQLGSLLRSAPRLVDALPCLHVGRPALLVAPIGERCSSTSKCATKSGSSVSVKSVWLKHAGRSLCWVWPAIAYRLFTAESCRLKSASITVAMKPAKANSGRIENPVLRLCDASLSGRLRRVPTLEAPSRPSTSRSSALSICRCRRLATRQIADSAETIGKRRVAVVGLA